MWTFGIYNKGIDAFPDTELLIIKNKYLSEKNGQDFYSD